MFRAHRAHHQGRQIVSIQPLVAVIQCRWLCRVQVGSLSLLMKSTMCSKHVELKIKYVEKNSASRLSFTKNHYMMHGQQNKKKTF